MCVLLCILIIFGLWGALLFDQCSFCKYGKVCFCTKQKKCPDYWEAVFFLLLWGSRLMWELLGGGEEELPQFDYLLIYLRTGIY